MNQTPESPLIFNLLGQEERMSPKPLLLPEDTPLYNRGLSMLNLVNEVFNGFGTPEGEKIRIDGVLIGDVRSTGDKRIPLYILGNSEHLDKGISVTVSAEGSEIGFPDSYRSGCICKVPVIPDYVRVMGSTVLMFTPKFIEKYGQEIQTMMMPLENGRLIEDYGTRDKFDVLALVLFEPGVRGQAEKGGNYSGAMILRSGAKV